MNINELDSFNLADTVKFHDRLNHRLWNNSEHLHPQVHAKLMEIARDFQEFLGVPDLDVKDVTISGSNAAYNYTPNSDIDLHLVVDLPEADNSEVYRELFDAKKFQYNSIHNIKIGGYDVELYVQNPNEEHHSQGIYSLLRNSWISVPRRRKAEIDDISTKSKYEDLAARIDDTINSGDHKSIVDLSKKIKAMRQSGLEKQGEFGSDNLAFKLLRNSGHIKRLLDARNAARDAELSLAEKAKPRQRVTYGFVNESPDGVNPTTKMFLESDVDSVLSRFFNSCIDFLEIKNAPEMLLHHDTDWSEQTGSFGQFDPDAKVLHLATSGRHILDILRTMAHELTHCKQNEKHTLPANAGETGSWWEDQANAIAGRIMRHWAEEHPEMFKDVSLEESLVYFTEGEELTEGRINAAAAAAALAAAMAMVPGGAQAQGNDVAFVLGKALQIYSLSQVTPAQVQGELKQELKNAIRAQRGDANAQNQSVIYKYQVRQQQQQQQPQVQAQPQQTQTSPQQTQQSGQYQQAPAQSYNQPSYNAPQQQVPQTAVYRESASGYIPKNKKEAKDPRWSMATSVDVGPGQVGKEANKLGLQTGRNGEPGQLMKSAKLRESRMPQPSQGPGKIRDLNEPLGPEFKPTMPKGTVRVDVSDTYDWYKLGKHFPNLDRANPSDFGKGPPSTIVSFGDEDTEHKYIDHLEKLGLTTTDIDPVDPNQPKGMKRQKTDPTYNVAENELAESLLQELALFEEQDLFEVKMTSKNLAQLAKAIPGVTVGLEFEMIVPNTEAGDDGDMEPDYDQDQRVRDIDDAVSFFDDGDYNGRNEVRRLREAMESDFFDWQTEQIDQDWHNNGFEFFQEYLDREEPFDPEDYQERAEDEIKAEFPELDPTSEDFGELVAEKLREINAEYYVETWEAQGRSYDYAQEEFTDEKRDEYSESDWLDSIGIRYASDVESNYSHVTWPYYSSVSGDDTDVKSVALNFMNYMGYDTIAVGEYHGYGGGYEKWNGSEWVKIGSNKPMDAFTVEPDGSLTGDDSGDAGLEFVSPPIPLDQISETMRKVQQWAGENGVYTGQSNSTSMHTNISIPGYDLDKLDYLKAAILLGDEHVLRQFDRIGNTYAKPAIEKVRQLVKQKPEKAQELLDKMKSHLNAEASKLIHSGQTDKYTSINTKDNRIEFRSPGGDYLSDIADNPQKMTDTINRMVVTLDAAMDPNKYKEEYQKKLYKILTGQQSGREARSGAKQEVKSSDKDLLNIFSRYAAGELPKAALKSFVRQAQLERGVAKGKQTGKMWWNVQWDNNRRIEVVAGSKEVAKQVAAEEWGVPESQLAGAVVTPLRPYEETPQQPSGPQWGVWDNGENSFIDRFGGTSETPVTHPSEQAALVWANRAGQQWRLDNGQVEVRRVPQEQPAQQQGSGTYRITTTGGGLIAGDEYGNDQTALQRAQYWAQRRGVDVVVRNPQGEEVGRVSASGEITPAAQQPAAQNQGNWGIWMANADRFARQTGTGDPGPASLRRFTSREAAEEFLTRTRAENPRMRTDVEVREIPADYQMPGTATAQEPQGVDTRVDYELYNRTTGEVIDTFPARNDDEAMVRLDDYREHGQHGQARHIATQMFGVRRGPGVTNTAQQSSVNNLTPRGPGPWVIVRRDNNQVYNRIDHTNRNAAETEARTWLLNNGWNPESFEVRTREGVGNTDATQGGIVDVAGEQSATAPQTLTRPGQGQQVFTGEWKVVDSQGQELYRFSGVGNSQADANRVAAQWAQRNQVSDEVNVVPVMGAA